MDILKLFFYVGKGAIDAPRYWQLRDDVFSAIHHVFPIPTGAVSFMAALAIRILNANRCIRGDAES
jgi:hypothetical protein